MGDRSELTFAVGLRQGSAHWHGGVDVGFGEDLELSDRERVTTTHLVEAGEPLGSVSDPAGLAAVGEHADGTVGG